MDRGESIKAKRKELGISVPKLAQMLAVPKDRIYKWEKGTKPSLYEDQQKINNFYLGMWKTFQLWQKKKLTIKGNILNFWKEHYRKRMTRSGNWKVKSRPQTEKPKRRPQDSLG